MRVCGGDRLRGFSGEERCYIGEAKELTTIMPKSRQERQLEEKKTTSHWAISEEACESMEEKYGWTLVDRIAGRCCRD